MYKNVKRVLVVGSGIDYSVLKHERCFITHYKHCLHVLIDPRGIKYAKKIQASRFKKTYNPFIPFKLKFIV